MIYAALLIALAALLYWLLIITEGTYLGTRIVVLLYDWTAKRYNAIKRLHIVNETRYLGIPLSEALSHIPRPWVLDVATGSGRLPLALLASSDRGVVIGVDYSLPMLREAQRDLAAPNERTWLIQGDAHRLVFADETFDAVTCLEALEFMRNPRQVVREMKRVLKPGGVLLVSNRVGPEAWLFFGRHCRRGRLESLLAEEGLEIIKSHRWQVHYDLIWAIKPQEIAKEEKNASELYHVSRFHPGPTTESSRSCR